jgi:glycosyltransferase involved in cell wall biosynthesis
LRVALIGPYPADIAKIPGGVPAVTFYVAQGLRAIDEIELHVIAPVGDIERDSVVRDGDVTIHYLAAPRRKFVPNLLANIPKIVAVLQQIKPDVVHSHTAVGGMAGLRSGYPTVLTIHGVLHREVRYQQNLYGKLATILEANLAKKAAGGVRHCIGNANYAIQAYSNYTKAKWHFVYNPIEDRFFDMPTNEIENKMLSASPMAMRKNVLGLVRAFERIHKQNPHPQLFVCGKVVQPRYFEQVRTYVESHDLGDTIHLLGFVSQGELARHFSEAAIITLFSFEETAPMLLAQAMCAGKCVIASKAGGIPDMVVDGETGYLVDVGDEEALATRSLELFSDPDLRRRLGDRAREVAEQRFRKEAVAAKTLEVYRDAISD